ncbi:MAG: DNRLRE domain-containing protein [Oscillospiraceae bacterium]|jgi:YD repeat-containing protein|nr:DNRLRE domain-containing protein [Oscillospiraceae bacterium]
MEDIDNTLIMQSARSAQGKTTAVYQTRESDTPIIIPQTLADGQQIKVTSDGYTVSLGVSQDNEAVRLDKSAQVVDVDALASNNLQALSDESVSTASREANAAEIAAEKEDAFALDKITSAATYKEIFDGADLEYVISSSKLKENIVIYEPQQEYIYQFDMDLGGLIPQTQEDGSIYLLGNADDSEPVFILQAPYMYDANNEVSYDVGIQLIENNGAYSLTVAAGQDWLNNEARVFPVVIDPTLEFNVSSSVIEDAYVSTLGKNTNYGDLERLWTGYYLLTRYRSYIKFDLPDLPDLSIVTGSVMTLNQRSSSVLTTEAVCAYDCYGLSTWSEGFITWNNQPFSTDKNGYTSATAVDYIVPSTGAITYFVDITKATKRWYEEGVNNGLMLAMADETTSGQVLFHSAESSTSALRPSVKISYVNNTGIEDYWTYETVSLGDSGSLSINHYNGGLTYLHGDVAMNGNRMPIAINHVYTSNKDNSSGNYLNMKLGNGFKLNILECIIALPQSDVLYSAGYHYKLIDSDNTVHFFKITSVANQFAYEYGTDLIITKNTDNSFAMTDEKGNVKRYNPDGYLVEIKDTNANSQTIVYDNGRITEVVDPVGRAVVFSYDSAGYLSGITDPSGRTVTYTYTSSGYLDKIIHPDVKETQILYNTNNQISRIIASDSSDILLTYKNVTSKNKTYYRVSQLGRRGQVDVLSGNRATVNTLTFSYAAGQTVVSDQYNKSNTYLFDNAGRTVIVKNHEGQAQHTTFNTSGNTNNSVQKASSTQAIVNNLAKNHSFQFSGDWNYWLQGSTTGTFEIISGSAYRGGRYLSITQESTYGNRYAEQSIAVEPGQTYTLSAYIKIPSAFTNPSGGARIRVVPMTTGGGAYEGIDFIQICDDGTRYQYTVTIPQNSTGELRISLEVATQGTAYFDAVQLEKTDVVNQYNLLENNDFTYVTSSNPDKWTKGGNFVSGDKVQNINGKNYMLISGIPMVEKYIYQTIPVNAKAGETIVYSAMAKSYSSGTPASDRIFAALIRINFADGTVGTDFAFFHYDVSELQMVSSSYTLPKDCTTITLYLGYTHQLNVGYFHSAALYVGSYGASYSYNPDGKLNTAKSDTGESVHYAYTGADLTAVTTKKDNETITSATYTYDDNHNVTSTTTSDGIKTEYFYEPQAGTATTYGIPTRVKTSTDNGANKAETSTAYTADYNYPVSTTNERGGVTQYNYDTTKGLLLSATDPNGNTRTYTYDPQNDRQLSVTGEAEPDEPITTEFNYQNNALSTIERNGTTYSYEYDHFMRVTATKVGSQTLASNTYNANSTLERSTFGNGQTYEPEYDSLDRITKEKYNGVETYAYKYNANNQVGEILDNESGKKYTLEYDLSGRLTDVVGSDGTRVKMHYDAAGNMENLSLSKNGTLLSGAMYSFQEDTHLIDQILLVHGRRHGGL